MEALKPGKAPQIIPKTTPATRRRRLNGLNTYKIAV
jgi:hypothetical protein